MENALFIHLTGFVVCFVLLFYFVAKYRAALAQDADGDEMLGDLTVLTVAKPAVAPRAAVLDGLPNVSALELADLKEQFKELHYRLKEYELTQNKDNADLQKQFARLEQRFSTFEQEYVNKLQPTLLSLIEELENMKVAGITVGAQETEKKESKPANTKK